MAMADIVKAITVTAELTGASMSGSAIAVMAQDLTARYDEDAISSALTRCRRELSRPLTAGAVFERLGQADGRPTADEAWAIALDARDEALTVVWNDEICEAFALARPVLEAGDKIGARMAFRDAYDRIARNGREAGRVPAWRASLGWDASQRTSALKKAESLGLLPAPTVAALLPAPSGGLLELALFGHGADVPDDIAAKCESLKKVMADAAGRRLAAAEEGARIEREDLASRKRRAAEMVSAASISKQTTELA